MWIFTVNGFFTVIQDRKDPNFVWLRARLREDIERNFPGVEVQEHPGADYLFRARLPREQVAQRVMELVMENNVTSHFKDVAIRTSSKPKHGNRSAMLYGVWNAGAAMQPIPPYSKVPRPEPKPFTPSPSKGRTWYPNDRTPGVGQDTLFSGSESRGLYGGAGAGYRASEFDWDSRSWGGTSSPDPALPSRSGPVPAEDASDDELSEWWAMLTPEEQTAYLDETEDQLRSAEAQAVEVIDVTPNPVTRPGNRRQRRKDKRRNRHNQQGQRPQGALADYEEKRAQRNREGLNGQEAQNRQAYLDKKGSKR